MLTLTLVLYKGTSRTVTTRSAGPPSPLLFVCGLTAWVPPWSLPRPCLTLWHMLAWAVVLVSPLLRSDVKKVSTRGPSRVVGFLLSAAMVPSRPSTTPLRRIMVESWLSSMITTFSALLPRSLQRANNFSRTLWRLAWRCSLQSRRAGLLRSFTMRSGTGFAVPSRMVPSRPRRVRCTLASPLATSPLAPNSTSGNIFARS
ncbi:hypothetical protein ACHAXR_008499 [Thalassiosira sp. AJA248-18]